MVHYLQDDPDTVVTFSSTFIQSRMHSSRCKAKRNDLCAPPFGTILQGDEWFTISPECPGTPGSTTLPAAYSSSAKRA